MVPANVVDRTVQQAGKHRNKEKTKKHIGKTEKQKNTLENKKKQNSCLDPPSPKSLELFFFCVSLFFFGFSKVFSFFGVSSSAQEYGRNF
jgi:hypothetical protein